MFWSMRWTMGLGVLRELDMSSLLDEEGEVEDKGCCFPREEHSCIRVDRPIGHDGFETGLMVDMDEGSLGS